MRVDGSILAPLVIWLGERYWTQEDLIDLSLLTRYLPGYTLHFVQSDADPDRAMQMSQQLFG